MFVKKVLPILFLCLTIGASAQDNYSFRTINKDNGLADNYVEQAFEDSRGFMWFATHAGLCRYDGHSFIPIPIPRLGKDDIVNISRNFINSIIEDKEKNLWLGTLSGVYIYNYETGKFKILDLGIKNIESFQQNFVDQIIFDKNDNAWIATRAGLILYNKKKNKCEHFVHEVSDNSTISDNYIHSICIDKNQDVWIGTRNGGLDKFNYREHNFVHYSGSDYGLNNKEIRSVFEDSKQNLWVVTSNGGIFCKKRPLSKFVRIKLINQTTKKEFNSILYAINEDTNGNIWISTATDGIVIYNPSTFLCTFYNDSKRSPQNICGNSIENISRDRQGNMWLSSHGGGVSVYSPMLSWFTYFTKSQILGSLPGNLVSSFCEDSEGNMWIGTDGNGFARFNRKNGQFESFTKENGLSSNAVLDIKEIKSNVLAIATYNGGLNLFNTRNGNFTKISYPSKRIDGYLQNIYGLFFDKTNSLLWCNTYGDGIQIFDCKTMNFLNEKELKKIFKFNDAFPFSHKTFFDNDQNCWILDGIQLNRCKSSRVHFYTSQDTTDKCKNINFVTDILMDYKNDIWISYINGIAKYDKRTDCFSEIKNNTEDLSEAQALLEDDDKNIWVSTIKSLFYVDARNRIISNLSKYWGLPQLQYFRRAAYKAKDGTLFFGGLKGFVMLHEPINRYSVKPKMFITRLIINDEIQKPETERAFLKKDISTLQNIELPYDRNYITIEFAALNFIDNDKSRFKYLLEGFNDTWIETEHDRKAQFTNLPPGDFIFKLKTTDNFGNWIESPLTLSITILPPWWRTPWFLCIMIILVVIIVLLIIKIRERSIVLKNKELESIVNQRTIELKTSNSNLEKQKATIQTQLDSIKENHFVIELKNNQLLEALEMKDKLLAVVAHDFKNPLSAMQGLIKIVQKKVIENEYVEIKKSVDSIASASSKLMNQMLSLIEWSMGSDKTVVHIPIDTNIDIIVADVLSLVSESANRKNIVIKSKTGTKHAAYADYRMITAIIRNLVINAIKYTEENGKIWVRTYENEEYVICEVEDTGIGMEQEYIDKIMSSEDLVADNYQTGLGLMICKTFIKRNKGKIEISSQLQKGTIFKVYLIKGSILQTEGAILEPEKDIEEETIIDKTNAELSMLIIDDNKDIITYLGEEFADTFSVYGAYDGKKGLQTAHNILPDIILCDVNLPILDGLTFCNMIKSDSLTSHIPIILVSAKSRQSDQIEGFKTGADDYVTKPFDIILLKQKVNTIIENRKRLIKYYKFANHSSDKQDLPVSHTDRITNEATTLILQNISNSEFTVDELAKQLFLSRSQLYRKFVSVLGQTPKEYMLTLKFEKAIEMLKTRKYRVSDIAYELGFTDSHYFSISFAQRFGVSPSNYFPKQGNQKLNDEE